MSFKPSVPQAGLEVFRAKVRMDQRAIEVIDSIRPYLELSKVDSRAIWAKEKGHVYKREELQATYSRVNTDREFGQFAHPNTLVLLGKELAMRGALRAKQVMVKVALIKTAREESAKTALVEKKLLAIKSKEAESLQAVTDSFELRYNLAT
jgi:hypothetical protein